MSQPEANPFKLLWEHQYPFGYWYNRLEKINPYNEYDKLEALWSAIQLSDIYAHVFAASTQNPKFPWLFLREHAYRGDIDDVLDALSEDGMATVGSLSKDANGLASFETADDYEIHEFDAIAGAFLGCPYTIDDENNQVEFDEDPDLHRAVANAILDFAERQKPLLNDFKHGFRILPVTPDVIEQFIGGSMIMEEDDQNEFENTVEDLKEALADDEWGFSFARMHTEDAEYGKEIQVDIYHVDAMACYKFAELILDALYNFVSVRRKTSLEVPIGELPIPVIEREEPILNHVFGFATPLLTEQDAEISKEDFMS